MTKISFLGTGTMGLPMCSNLLGAGFELRVWNRSPERARPLSAQGADVAEELGQAADGASVAITMLSDADAVLGTAGRALDALDEGATWIQMGTIGIQGTERCVELAERHRVAFVDAPVLGTRQPAEEGKLVILASGPEET